MSNRSCKWPIACPKHAVEGTNFCGQHNRAMGVKKGKNPDRKKELTAYYDQALKKMPKRCEECGELLVKSMVINPRTVVAHLLAKNEEHGFPSVATNQANKAYLCDADHHGYDKKGKDFIVKMRIYPIIKARVAILLPLLTPEELARVPDYLTN